MWSAPDGATMMTVGMISNVAQMNSDDAIIEFFPPHANNKPPTTAPANTSKPRRCRFWADAAFV